GHQGHLNGGFLCIQVSGCTNTAETCGNGCGAGFPVLPDGREHVAGVEVEGGVHGVVLGEWLNRRRLYSTRGLGETWLDAAGTVFWRFVLVGWAVMPNAAGASVKNARNAAP
ncbi:MAG: hypothetical protein RL497_248, partial [Pseudomonadota bacterium]